MKRDRLYADTSVIGGCFDQQFADDSLRFIDTVRNGKAILLLSDVIIREIGAAPQRVQEVLMSLPAEAIERIELTSEIIALRNAYLSAGVLHARWMDDATHVAAATVSHADAIVSWNFTHIVRLDKIKGFNQVNLLNGYGILTIVSPKEVRYEE